MDIWFQEEYVIYIEPLHGVEIWLLFKEITFTKVIGGPNTFFYRV